MFRSVSLSVPPPALLSSGGVAGYRPHAAVRWTPLVEFIWSQLPRTSWALRWMFGISSYGSTMSPGTL